MDIEAGWITIVITGIIIAMFIIGAVDAIGNDYCSVQNVFEYFNIPYRLGCEIFKHRWN